MSSTHEIFLLTRIPTRNNILSCRTMENVRLNYTITSRSIYEICLFLIYWFHDSCSPIVTFELPSDESTSVSELPSARTVGEKSPRRLDVSLWRRWELIFFRQINRETHQWTHKGGFNMKKNSVQLTNCHERRNIKIIFIQKTFIEKMIEWFTGNLI